MARVDHGRLLKPLMLILADEVSRQQKEALNLQNLLSNLIDQAVDLPDNQVESLQQIDEMTQSLEDLANCMKLISRHIDEGLSVPEAVFEKSMRTRSIQIKLGLVEESDVSEVEFF